MARSKSKLIYVHRSQFKRFLFNKVKREIRTQKYYNLLFDRRVSIRPFFLLWKRAGLITKHYISQKIGLYNGKFFVINDIKLDAKGYKLGEVNATRKKPKHKGKQRQTSKVVKKTGKEKIKKK